MADAKQMVTCKFLLLRRYDTGIPMFHKRIIVRRNPGALKHAVAQIGDTADGRRAMVRLVTRRRRRTATLHYEAPGSEAFRRLVQILEESSDEDEDEESEQQKERPPQAHSSAQEEAQQAPGDVGEEGPREEEEKEEEEEDHTLPQVVASDTCSPDREEKQWVEDPTSHQEHSADDQRSSTSAKAEGQVYDVSMAPSGDGLEQDPPPPHVHHLEPPSYPLN